MERMTATLACAEKSQSTTDDDRDAVNDNTWWTAACDCQGWNNRHPGYEPTSPLEDELRSFTPSSPSRSRAAKQPDSPKVEVSSGKRQDIKRRVPSLLLYRSFATRADLPTASSLSDYFRRKADTHTPFVSDARRLLAAQGSRAMAPCYKRPNSRVPSVCALLFDLLHDGVWLSDARECSKSSTIFSEPLSASVVCSASQFACASWRLPQQGFCLLCPRC